MLGKPSTTTPPALFSIVLMLRCLQEDIWTRYWYLTPVIVATQETMIRRIVVPGQQDSLGRPYLEKTHHKKGWGSGVSS
jgi:hypothetical protein